MFVECKVTPESGPEFTLKNITDINMQVSRMPGRNNDLRQKSHQIAPLVIERLVSLRDGETARLEEGPNTLASAREKKAFFAFEITMAPAVDSKEIVKTIRADRAYICDYQLDMRGDDLYERISISASILTVDNAEYQVDLTA